MKKKKHKISEKKTITKKYVSNWLRVQLYCECFLFDIDVLLHFINVLYSCDDLLIVINYKCI